MKNTTTNTPTNCTALIVINQQEARSRAAHARHAVTLPEVLHMYAFTSSAMEGGEYTHADRITQRTLSRLASQDGTPMLYDLAAAMKRDELAREYSRRIDAAREHISAAEEAEEGAKVYRSTAAAYRRYARRIATPMHEAVELYAAAAQAMEQADKLTAAAKQHRAAARVLDPGESIPTMTDRADLVQAAALALWSTGSAQAAAAAVRAAIRSSAHPDALAGSHTDIYPAATAPAWMVEAVKAAGLDKQPTDSITDHPRKVDAIGQHGKRDGFLTYEYKEASKPRKDGTSSRAAGWCIVHHRYTAQRYISFETFATGEDAQPLANNGGINYIENVGRAEELAAMTATLSERQRAFVYNVLDNTAAKAGQLAVEKLYKAAAAKAEEVKTKAAAARNEARSKYAGQPKQLAAALASIDKQQAAYLAKIDSTADSKADSVRQRATFANALHRAGIYSKSKQAEVLHDTQAAMLNSWQADPVQRKELSRIRAKLDAAKAAAKHEQPAAIEAPAAVDVLKMWKDAAKATPDTLHPFPGHLATITSTSTTSGRKAAHHITWATKYNSSTARPLTAAEQQQEAAQEVQRIRSHAAAAALLEYRRKATDTNRRQLDSMTPAQRDRIARAIMQHREKAKREQERRRAAAKAAGLYGLNTTLAMWQSWTAEEKAAHLEFLRSLNS